MKLTSKIVVSSLSVLTALTLAVGTTATYAWFRTVRTASLNLSDVTLRTRTSDLLMTITSLTSGNAAFTDGETGLTRSTTDSVRAISMSASAYNVTDVSSDGRHFYHPEFAPLHDDPSDPYGLVASSINEVYNGTKDLATGYEYFYVQTGITLTNSGSEKMNVYIDGGSAIQGASTLLKDTNAAKATRVSLYSVDTLIDTTGEKPVDKTFVDPFELNTKNADKKRIVKVVTYWAGAAESDTTAYPYEYLYKLDADETKDEDTRWAYTHYDGATDPGTGITTYTPVDVRTGENIILKGLNTSILHTGKFNTVLSKKPTTADIGATVCTLDAKSSQSFVLSVWIEGTSSYATGLVNKNDLGSSSSSSSSSGSSSSSSTPNGLSSSSSTPYIDIVGGKTNIIMNFVGFAEAVSE